MEIDFAVGTTSLIKSSIEISVTLSKLLLLCATPAANSSKTFIAGLTERSANNTLLIVKSSATAYLRDNALVNPNCSIVS